jgi:hypothetical protein
MPAVPAPCEGNVGGVSLQLKRPHKSGAAAKPKITITGVIADGGALNPATIVAVTTAAQHGRSGRYIAYAGIIKIGGSLAWRANNPGNLRSAKTRVATLRGATGNFAIFPTMDAGREAQRALYLSGKYRDMKVRDAINLLTPPSENDTAAYLKNLSKAGVDLDKDVKSQIDKLMSAIQKNEGMIPGTVVPRANGLERPVDCPPDLSFSFSFVRDPPDLYEPTSVQEDLDGRG